MSKPMEQPRPVLAVASVCCLVWMVASAVAQQQPKGPSLEQIFVETEIWGPDLPAALASLDAWREAGEERVAIYADRIEGRTPYESAEDAAGQAATLSRILAAGPPTASGPLSRISARYVGPQRRALAARVVTSSLDGRPRVALVADGAELLAPELRTDTVERVLGPPDEVVRELVQSEREYRPAVLTRRHYAGALVTFVETDLAPRPGYVDHVVLDVAAVAAGLAEEAP